MVCFATDSLSGQITFLNSAFRPLNQLFFGAASLFAFSPIFSPQLFCFLMHGVCLAESAVFLCFHSVRMSFLILCHVVITLFTFRTCQYNFCAHNFHLRLHSNLFLYSLFFRKFLKDFPNFEHKKKTSSISRIVL